ncbi:MAG: hypothetical protein HFH61_05330 [Lachnospiraceae bacterium]|nr:hypothetical protein [Lachnospiraceae bacterium]
MFKEKMSKYFDDIRIVYAANQGGGMLELKDGVAVDNFGSGAEVPCDMVFNRLHITCQGYLTACCVDFDNMMAVADLKVTPLEVAWNNDDFVKLRRQHLNNSIGNNMCYMCIHNMACERVMPLVSKFYEK